MSLSIFEYSSYRSYLQALFSEERGKQSELAKYLNCQSSFISQVLSGRSHLSLEHAISVSEFLNHTQEERGFFMLLIQKEKSGTQKLEKYFSSQIAEIKKQRQIIRERIQVKEGLKPEEQVTYYSVWWYAAIHILVALPGSRTREEIAKRLSLELEIVDYALRFLVRGGLVNEKGGTYSIGSRRIHLGTDSPLLARHHSNWRMRAIQAVDYPRKTDLHYSGIIGISKEDGGRIRNLMLELLQNSESIVQNSKEDTPFVMLLDLFQF